ncbi:tRNA uridine-5-carboxymethylaminomethyl(34) synthesis GTPase MnmE [Fusibacter paucivorans]|uniref:tRNA modification GTPase MnmE n=1 Tax=Fusibacter paucivorans TaxID=76009 RepID=A0ABS5PMX2_9FIRM|nr:tRNA uridine-5-carboxymethylaminomethyl(34) synthesis GTPase MnmE [Fusibacter paucivorans]MBS7526529.1 tRNA uridine-5-carboxymethylaminomethyl(34) synthesis GTPase MnmE [Fusibacter paucivorans]
MLTDTIAAISTPIGEGAIGIVRMSGSDSFKIIDQLFRAKSEKSTWEDKKFKYGYIFDEDRLIDEVMVVKMHAPNTYTRESIVEINCHGGAVPLREILRLCLKNGARLADRGEFTKRAFLNGRIDLAQAESIMDLIQSKTDRGFDIAIQQLEGNLSKKINHIRHALVQLMARVEVGIDYPEEDIEEITYQEIQNDLQRTSKILDDLLKTSRTGKIVREGLKTVIIGKPNVGKSSLMNALLKDARAIVTDIPGTTRDVIEEFLSINGIPIKLVDTAGIRETEDIVEKMGVEKSKSYFNTADLIIFMLNGSEQLTEEDHVLIDKVKGRPAIILVNKSDLEQNIEIDYIKKQFESHQIIYTSMSKDIGVEAIENAIQYMIDEGGTTSTQSEMVSNARHIALIEKSQLHVNEAIKATINRLPYDFIEVDVKEAIELLGFITGDSVSSDLMNEIFGQFCLGK